MFDLFLVAYSIIGLVCALAFLAVTLRCRAGWRVYARCALILLAAWPLIMGSEVVGWIVRRRES